MAATALTLPAADSGISFDEVAAGLASHSPDFTNALNFAEFDFKDDRYPTLPRSLKALSQVLPDGARPPTSDTAMSGSVKHRSAATALPAPPPAGEWTPERLMDDSMAQSPAASRPQSPPENRAPAARAEGTLSPRPTSSPAGRAERTTADDDLQRPPSKLSDNPQDMGRGSSGRRSGQEVANMAKSSPRHPSLPGAGVAGNAGPSSPIVPLSAGPSYNPSMQIPISPKPRAYAQHPTYITPAPSNGYAAPPQVPKEEVCIECAMRDEDMVDVDVTGPGVWERESDVFYVELLQREKEEEAKGIPPQENRPRARGGALSEENLRIWISINPKEPSSRQQTLDQYVRSQRTLLEAEALAQARAAREMRHLDNKVRDTYSQLRRSAYDLNLAAKEETHGVRIKAPRSSSMPGTAMIAHAHSNSREMTLLENGMVVEHVDIRKEEKAERDRQRREERRARSRARKSSKGSAIDVTSVYSMPIPIPRQQTDSGYFSGSKGPESRYSQSFSPRPSSVLTNGGERPATMMRAYSQASFSDMQSIGSTSSPRRSRFFGFKNLAAGWRSQESFAPSGSMVDMHVALSREQQFFQAHPELGQDVPSNSSTIRAPLSPGLPSERTDTPISDLPKKKNGFKKIWKLVTGSSSKNNSRMAGRTKSRSMDRAEDDAPLAPPPPLSYLVDQQHGGLSSRRHVSTPSLPMSLSPNPQSPYPPSQNTAASSLISSPTSSRHPPGDKDNTSDRKDSGHHGTDPDHVPSADGNMQEVDSRGRPTQSSSRTLSSLSGPLTPVTPPSLRPVSVGIRRDKSLPPLPGESMLEFPNHPMPDARPQTVYTYDPTGSQMLPPQAPFRATEGRRQSFGGLASKPAIHTVPGKGTWGRSALNVPPFLAEEQYAEFGVSHLSLNGPWEGQAMLRPVLPQTQPKQRRSKFGLSSIFGKKSYEADSKELGRGIEAQLEPIATHRTSASGEHSAGYGGPGSAHSSAPRASVTSRKNIAELVEQDSEFVAYRYPSSDQRFDLQ